MSEGGGHAVILKNILDCATVSFFPYGQRSFIAVIFRTGDQETGLRQQTADIIKNTSNTSDVSGTG